MYEEKEIKYKKRKINKKKFKTTKTINIKPPNFINKINWKQILIKLLVLIIVMMLIIFITSRINKNYKEKNQVLNNNINKIIKATEKFYTNENLPHNIGDSNSLILEEMINNKLVDNIKDRDNNKCNTTDSYIIITKTTTTDYHLKVYLTCKSEEKTTEKDLICNKTCKAKNS